MIGKAREQMDAAVDELGQARTSVERSREPLDGAVDTLQRQMNAKTEAVPVATSVVERVRQLKASVGSLGALLMDAKIASQDMHATSTEAEGALREGYTHAANARQLIGEATDNDSNEGTSAANHIKGMIGTAVTFKQTGEASVPQFSDTVEKVQQMMAALETLGTLAKEIAGEIPQLGYRGDVEIYLTDVPFYAVETAIGIEQGIQSIQDRTNNW